MTLPSTTNGAIVIVSPLRNSPMVLFQISFPLSASTAMVWQSSVLMKTLPSENAAPRETPSQHASPNDAEAGFGSYFHFICPDFPRSSANKMFGYGVITYMVDPT